MSYHLQGVKWECAWCSSSTLTNHFISYGLPSFPFQGLLIPGPCLPCPGRQHLWVPPPVPYSQLALGPGSLHYCCLNHLRGLVFHPWCFPKSIVSPVSTKQHPVMFSSSSSSFFALKPIASFLNVISCLLSFSLDASIYFLFIKLKIGLQASLTYSRDEIAVYRLFTSLCFFCSLEALYSSWKFPSKGKVISL